MLSETHVKNGDVWRMGRHKLLCGDSTLAPLVKEFTKDKDVKVCVADPPYGVNYKSTAKRSSLYQLALKNDHISNWSKTFQNINSNTLYVWYATHKMDVIAASLADAGYEIKQSLVWKKNRSTLQHHFYHLKHEICIFAVKEGIKSSETWKGDRKQHSVMEVATISPNNRIHPTQKPFEVYLPAIENHAHEKEWVIDPFAGSGTIFEAAQVSNRNALGIELCPDLCKGILKRMSSFDLECSLERNIFEEAKSQDHS